MKNLATHIKKIYPQKTISKEAYIDLIHETFPIDYPCQNHPRM